MTTEEMIISALSDRQVDGIEITPSPKKSRIIEYDQIDSKRKHRQIPYSVEKWRTKDFVSYARKIYRERYGRDWGLNYTAACTEMLQVKDCLLDIIGKCDNKLLASYLNWFFENLSDGFVNKSTGFYLNQLKQDWVIDSFISNYEVEMKKSTKQLKQENQQTEDFSQQKLDAVYLLSEERFVVKYGVVIAVNYLLKRKNKNPKDAAYLVYKTLYKLNQKDRLGEAVEATKKNGPYPSTLKFLDPQWLLRKIQPKCVLRIKIDDNNSHEVLKNLAI